MKKRVLVLLILLLCFGIIVNIAQCQPDAYADHVFLAMYTWYNLDYAIGEPDSQYARSSQYASTDNVYLVLSMGEGEEIVDGPGNDLIIYGSPGFRVYVMKKLADWGDYIGHAPGTNALDIGNDDLDTYRYVRLICWYTAEPTLSLEFRIDAIEAINYIGPFTVEVDAVDDVDRIIDGDTLDVNSGDRIRLADIDAPEYGEIGYTNAKNALIDLVLNETVYLDVDDIYGTDVYGRLVCVVYVRYNVTHFTNVNKALLAGEYVVVDNYDNEFNPYSWPLYVHENVIPEFPSLVFLPLLMIVLLFVAFIYRRKRFT